MIEHIVEISNPRGRSVRIMIRLSGKRGTWQTLEKGYFCQESGVADTGFYPTYPIAWIALYGGNRVDNKELVFHLDDFLCHTHVNPKGGEGWVYAEDGLLMERGELSWRLIS